ncbi:unnamed protein product [marine sediment metagenome]|uniref:Uncharacterized protein n=1 Tax=marine sediment metagenome TaxID=412755 RepID=X1C0A3_9ZZZZ
MERLFGGVPPSKTAYWAEDFYIIGVMRVKKLLFLSGMGLFAKQASLLDV